MQGTKSLIEALNRYKKQDEEEKKDVSFLKNDSD